MIRILTAIITSILLFNLPARAAWYEASSEHFVIYADQSAQSVQLFAERLEEYHAGMAFMLQKEPASPSPSNRVTIFVVGSTANVRKLAEIKSRYVAGVYLPRAGNIIAIVPQLRSSGNRLALSPETVLRHEYAHHFLFNITNNSYPLWYQEGFAEFYASGREDRDGTLLLGGPAYHRAYELILSREVPIDLLLDTAKYRQTKSRGYDQFYGRSWLLFHFLTFDTERKGQIEKYQNALVGGSSEIDAAEEVFGDLDVLEKQLDRYAERKRLTTFALPPSVLKAKPVTVRRMRDGEAAMMPVIMESRAGVGEEEAKKLVVDARNIAALYPDDPAVLEALAEAEFDAGYIDQAIAAADRALALDGKRVRAQIQKIYAYSKRAAAAESSDAEEAAWATVRKAVVAANRIENDHPIPLIEYYKSYRSAGMEPPEIAVQGLQRALQLAPFDQGLRMNVAAQYMNDGQNENAAITLRPVAFNPHPSNLTAAAQTLLDEAEAKAAKQKGQASNAAGGAKGEAAPAGE